MSVRTVNEDSNEKLQNLNKILDSVEDLRSAARAVDSFSFHLSKSGINDQ